MAQAGIPPYAILEAATRNAAEYLRRKDSGMISVGNRADLVLLNANPLTDITNADRVAGVMVSGKWLDRAALDQMMKEVEDAVRP